MKPDTMWCNRVWDKFVVRDYRLVGNIPGWVYTASLRYWHGKGKWYGE